MANQESATGSIVSVSIVMCTYNGAAFVAEQLHSLINQTYPITEIVVFDDASTDTTVAIVQQLALQYPVIKLHINPHNIGFNRNFEQAMQAATSDAIAICDQDDVWVKDKIEKMVSAWKPESSLIYCYSYVFHQELPVNPQPSARITKFEGTDARKLCMYNTISGHTILCRKTLLPLLFPFSEQVPYDWWMAVVAACNGGVQYYPEVLVLQRMHSSNKLTVDERRIDKIELSKRRKQELINTSILFARAPNLPDKHKAFFLELATLAAKSLHYRFYLPLFLFLIRYRHLVFYLKKRKIAFFSQIKHGYRRTITPLAKPSL